MTAVFIVCAAIGGTVLVVQFLLALIGLGGDAFDIDVSGDVGHDFSGDFHGDVGGGFHGDADMHGDHPVDHGSTWLFSVLSFRTVVAALAFFGLAGLWAESTGASAPSVLLVAVAAGFAAMMGVYWMMRGMKKLQADGSVRIHRAVGRHGNVYLRIPGNRSGAGKIQFNLQNRTMEYSAITSGPDLPTGAKVVVVGVVNPTTLDVQAE
ncbi:MAG: hypothetical protein KKE86_06420 [Planctomycetes bacterium]|nr:hypothetical protein [Planctomycetota bacterium]